MTDNNTNNVEPTPEMIAFSDRRTKEHIARVAANLRILATVTNYGDELASRAESHDASKFEPEERIPYVWLTEFHRKRHCGETFEYPRGIEERVRRAIDHHVTSNRHHPEYHADPNDMTEIDLIEMVCDWTAMSQEFEQDNGSARGWADKTIGTRVHFNSANTEFVYQMIDELDRQNAINNKERNQA